MRNILRASVFAAALAVPAPADVQTLEKILKRMDEAAETFRGISARLKRITHTAVINDDSEENGSIWIKRSKNRDMRMLIQFTKPDPKSVAFRDRKVEIYYPNIKTVQEIDLGKHSQLVDQFLLLGFGMPGKEVAKNYSLKYLGPDKVAGQSAARLELIPKSPQAREHLTKVELWISETSGQPVQQKFYLPSGDYNVITFIDAKIEPSLPDDAVRIRLPRGVKREYPQK